MNDPRDRRERRDPRFTADKTVMYPGGFPPGYGPKQVPPVPKSEARSDSQTSKTQPHASSRGHNNLASQQRSGLDPAPGLSHSSQQAMPSASSPVRDHRPKQPCIEPMTPQGAAIQFPAQSTSAPNEPRRCSPLGGEQRVRQQGRVEAKGRGREPSDELMAGVGHTVYEFSGQNSASVPNGDRSMQGINRDSNSRHNQTFYSEGSFAIAVEERPHASNLRSGGAWKLFVPVLIFAVVGGLGWALMHDRQESGAESAVLPAEAKSSSGEQPAPGGEGVGDTKPNSLVSDSKSPGQSPSPSGTNLKSGSATGTDATNNSTSSAKTGTNSQSKKEAVNSASTSKSTKKKSTNKSKKSKKKKSIKPKSGPRPKRPPKKLGGLDDLPEPD